jgi:hypothetical protein
MRNKALACQKNDAAKYSGYHCSVSDRTFEKFSEGLFKWRFKKFLQVLKGR